MLGERRRSPSCGEGDDQDPANYCRTTPAAYEREFRKGLDVLITVPQLKVGVASLVRVFQLCNYSAKQACSLLGPGSCQTLWTAAAASAAFAHGICGSLTIDCSEERIRDAYELAKSYRDILARVTAEYADLTPGDSSVVIIIGGESVGGALKAAGVTLTFSEADRPRVSVPV